MLGTWAILAGLLLFISSFTIFSNNAYSESNIVILEVEPNPAGTDAGNEWVRLFNPSSNSINLSGWQISSTHGNTNTHTLSGNIGACDGIKIIFPSQFIDNEDELLILYDNTGSVVDSTPIIYDTSNDGSTWKITTPSCDSSQPEPEATPEPEPEYLPNGCPVGYPYIWSDGYCYSVPEPVATPETTTPEPSIHAENAYYVHIDELPSWADYAGNVMYDSTRNWEKPNPGLKFYVTENPNYADFMVRWVKDFGGEQHVGYAYRDFVEVGLGDSLCYGKWQPYSADYVTQIMTHEIGHILGHEHSNDVNSIMYPTSSYIEYGTVEEEFTLTEGYGQFYIPCTSKDKTSIDYSVSVDDPTYGFDVYFVPSVESFDDWADGKSFKCYLDKECFGKNYRSYSGTCNGVAKGSGLLVIMDGKLTNPLTKLTITTKEISSTRIFSSPKIATEDPTTPTIPTTPRIPTTTTKSTTSLITLSLFSDGKNYARSFTVEEGKPFEFAGKLTDGKGSPVSGSSVYIDDKYDSGFQIKTRTDQSGTYLFYITAEHNLKNIDNDKSKRDFIATSQVGSETVRSEIAKLTIITTKTELPDWIKNTADWWSSGAIDDRDFSKGIEYMIKEKIIRIPQVQTEKEMGTFSIEKIPDWIKNNAKWWSEGKISDNDFAKGIEYMVKVGIIKI